MSADLNCTEQIGLCDHEFALLDVGLVTTQHPTPTSPGRTYQKASFFCRRCLTTRTEEIPRV